MFILILSAYALVGALAGILGGLLGIGGGVITVPCLYLLFRYLDYPQADVMYLAIGTSLAAMIFNTLASTWAHNKRKGVLWDVFRQMALGLISGSLIGALVAEMLSGGVLKMVFGLFLCVLGYYFWKKHTEHAQAHRIPKKWPFFLWSGAIGAVSNILGIGGGTLILPFLVAHKVPTKKAIGTSAACSLLVTTIGAFSYLILGLKTIQIPQDIGYIDLPSFIIIGVVSFFTAPFGAKLAQKCSVQSIRRIFSIVLFLTGILMLM